MTVSYSKNFLRQYAKLPPKVRQKVDERILLWQNDRFNSKLREHKLRGTHKYYRSIDITGDYRALYLQRDNEVVFDAVGAHSQLYG